MREYALEQLESRACFRRPRRDALRPYYVELGERNRGSSSRTAGSATRCSRLAEERDNLRGAVRYLLDAREWDAAASFAWTLYVYWWVDGHLGEVCGWWSEMLGR